jgi:phosphomannomutase / phosphoglucomutase
LKTALSAGLLRTGIQVVDAGQVPTPIAYFAARQVNAGAVLMVTASHNPAAYNGLKLMFGSSPTTPEQLAEIRALTDKREFRRGDGRLEAFDPIPEYARTTLERWDHLRGNGWAQIVLDAGNGAWSGLAPAIFRDLAFQVSCVSCIADGSFPDRSPDCSIASNLIRLCNEVSSRPNSIGIAWDGDGDRVAFVDEDGAFVPPDEIALLLANAVLRKQQACSVPVAKVVVDVKCSDLVRQTIEQLGATALPERTGHAFMRGRMVAEQATLGLDACGHYFFEELDGGDDGLFAALFLLDVLRKRGQSLAEARRTLPQMFSSPEFRIPAALLSYANAAEALSVAFAGAAISEIDGLRFALNDGVVLIRESGTEPVISLRVEGFDAASHQRILSECCHALPEVAPQIRRHSQESCAH